MPTIWSTHIPVDNSLLANLLLFLSNHKKLNKRGSRLDCDLHKPIYFYCPSPFPQGFGKKEVELNWL